MHYLTQNIFAVNNCDGVFAVSGIPQLLGFFGALLEVELVDDFLDPGCSGLGKTGHEDVAGSGLKHLDLLHDAG